MKLGKFNSEGVLVLIADNVPGLSDPSFIPIPDSSDPNNTFLNSDGKVGPRTEVTLVSDRTVLLQDGKDTAIISGLPKKATMLIDGVKKSVTGPTLKVTTTNNAVHIEATGAYYGNTLSIRGSSAEEMLEEVRAARDVLLASSDWTQMADAPLSDEQKDAWRNYRTALRNITSDQPNTNIDKVIWPTKP